MPFHRGTREFTRTYLDCEDRDTTSTLSQDPVTGEQWLEAEQGVPGGQSGTGQSGSFDKVEVAGQSDESFLIEGSVLLESPIDDTASPGSDNVRVDRSRKMGLVEEGDDLVTSLESVDL